MSDRMNSDNNSDRQLAALIASATIVTGFLLYWLVQIQDVLDMLELAYG
jgi:hypothetical protein